MSLWQQVLLVWVAAAIAQGMAWAWQQRHANAGIVDVVWSFGVGGTAVLVALTGSGAMLPRLLLAVLGGLWGLRLGLHLLHRVRGEPEDGRYAELRKRWGNGPLKWLAMFQFQALLIVLFSLPFLAVAENPVATLNLWFIAGVVTWIGSVLGEAIADRQLAEFRGNPANRGTTCRDGLWRYSRHPNYFFEWLHWFAYVLLAIGSPVAWLAWSGPLVMYVFLRWVSGIPFTEAHALRSRGEDYARYQRSTSILFPWFPKEEK